VKVLLLPHRFGPHGQGGVETWAAILRRALQARGHEVVLLTRDDRPGPGVVGTLTEEQRHGRIWWLRHRHGDGQRFADSWRDARLAPAIDSVVDAERPDIVHIGHPDGWGVLPLEAARVRGIPCVATLHDYKWLCARGQLVRDGAPCEGPEESACTACVSGQLGRGPVRAALGRRLGRILGPLDPPAPSIRARGRWRSRRDALTGALASCVLTAPSRYVAQWHSTRLGMPVEHLPNGVEGEFSSPVRAPGPVRIGFFGTDTPTKGLDRLLEVAARRPDVHFQIHGPPPGAPRANVTWFGPYPAAEATARMAGVDAIALPSQWAENAPYVALEARLAGRPLLVSALGGLPELVRDGVDGRVLPHDDPRAWVEALDQDALFELTAEAPPTADAMAARFEAVYDRASEPAASP